MDRRSFLKGSAGGLALIAMAKGAPLAEAFPYSRFNLVPIEAVPRDVVALAKRFTAIGHFPGTVGDLPMEYRPMVLTSHSGMGNTEWHFFMGTAKYYEDVELVVRVIVPDPGSGLGYKYCYEIARLLGFPSTVYKDGKLEADFEDWGTDTTLTGYCVGFIT